MIRIRFATPLGVLALLTLPVTAPAQQPGQVAFTLDERGLTASSGDGAFAFTAGARLHADVAQHRGDDGPGLDAVDGTHIRRARIELDGTVQRDWNWAAQVDFAGNDASLKDFVLEFAGLERVDLAVGHQKQPYSLELEMSSNDIPFLERSIDSFLLAPFVGRAVGVRAEAGGERWFAAAGLFGDGEGTSIAGDAGWGTSGRFVFAPTIAADRVLHLGARAAHRELGDDAVVRVRDETTSFSELSIVDTGALTDARSVTLAGPEAAYVRGPWSVTGEFTAASIDRRGAPDLGFDGFHVAATYALGGESRADAYRIGSGEFKRLDPARGFDVGAGGGTWELSARYGSLDLDDADTRGGTERALTVGANWYANANVRMLLAWTRILDTDESTPPRARAEDMDIVAARAQFAF